MNIRSITESLEKKYLNESRRLNEKLSPDMPDWLAKRILTTKYTLPPNARSLIHRDLGGRAHLPDRGYLNSDKADYLKTTGAKKNPQSGKEPQYIDTESIRGGLYDPSLFTQMRKKGIRLDTVKVIEGPVPISENDKRLQSPNIPVFLLDDGVVYIPGVNDEEKLGARKSLGAYKISALLSKCKKFAYIDGNDPDNFFSASEYEARKEQKKGAIFRYGPSDEPKEGGKVQRNRNGDALGGDSDEYDEDEMDKSGYPIIPSMERYEDELAKIKATKIFDIMKEYEDYLNDCQQELSYYISSLSMRELKASGDDIEDVQTNLMHAIDSFLDVQSSIDHIVNHKKWNDERKKEELGYLMEDDFEDLEEYIDDLKESVKDIFNSTIDWI